MYKRQVQEAAIGLEHFAVFDRDHLMSLSFSFCRGLPRYACSFYYTTKNPGVASLFLCFSLEEAIPVSYTHLDVYKRQIQKGDTLPLREPQFWLNAMDKRSASYPLPEGVPVIHVIMGPQDDCFSPRGKRTFLQKEYTLGQSCDRMGYRL